MADSKAAMIGKIVQKQAGRAKERVSESYCTWCMITLKILNKCMKISVLYILKITVIKLSQEILIYVQFTIIFYEKQQRMF